MGGVTTMVTSIIAAVKATKTDNKINQQKQQLDSQDETLDKIQDASNGTLARTAHELKNVRQEVINLKWEIAQLQKEALSNRLTEETVELMINRHIQRCPLTNVSIQSVPHPPRATDVKLDVKSDVKPEPDK